ncbi:MAG: zinc-binding dehydrogenase, partial [Deinococcota bacterium]
LQALRSACITHLTVVDKSAARLELAASLGAHETVLADDFSSRDHPKYELVVDATGVPQVMANALNYVRPAGTFWIFGVAPDDATIAVSPYEVFQKDLTIVGSFAVNKTFQEAINLIQSGAVQVEPLISHVLPLASFAEALYIAEHDPARMKVQFAINAD